MLAQYIAEIFERDLNKLSEEINQYKNESDLWKTAGEISNSAGNLCLHLIGNLNHFIGAGLGKTNYIRDRDAEFSSKNIPREELTKNIQSTIEVVRNALQTVMPEDFEKDFPIQMQDKTVKTGFMILHLLTHLSYHLRQINYHRRLLASN